MAVHAHLKRVQEIEALLGYVERQESLGPRQMLAIIASVVCGALLMTVLVLVNRSVPLNAFVLDGTPFLLGVVVYALVSEYSKQPKNYMEAVHLELAEFSALDAQAVVTLRQQLAGSTLLQAHMIDAWVAAETQAMKAMYGEPLTL